MKKYCERYKITRVKVFVVVICIIVFFVVAVGVPYWLNIYIINKRITLNECDKNLTNCIDILNDAVL